MIHSLELHSVIEWIARVKIYFLDKNVIVYKIISRVNLKVRKFGIAAKKDAEYCLL